MLPYIKELLREAGAEEQEVREKKVPVGGVPLPPAPKINTGI